jgi:peptidoglycan/xylan/chitin deacetylase (PgdA/CDA1 family)
LKDGVASLIWRAHGHPLSAPLFSGSGHRALVVGYHRVVEDFADAAETDMPTLLTSRAMFERQMDWIGRHFRFVTLDEIGEQVESGEPFARPVAAVTFDDGYRDVYDLAFPALQRKGIPAAVFVVTELVGRSCWQTHDRLYTLMVRAYRTWDDPRRGLTCLLNDVGIPASRVLPARRDTRTPYKAASGLLPLLSQSEAGQLIEGLHARVGRAIGQAPLPLTWPMIAAMRDDGATIGSHTRTHAWLARESPQRTADELAGSKQELERRLNGPVDHFAYPGGQFTPAVVNDVARSGYRFAYTACRHADRTRPALTIERLLLWERSSIDARGAFSPEILSCQAHSLWPSARTCARVHTV